MSVSPPRVLFSISLPIRYCLGSLTAAYFGLILTLCLAFALSHWSERVTASSKPGNNQPNRAALARMSERISVHAAGRANPTINLSDGREVLTSYVGPQ